MTITLSDGRTIPVIHAGSPIRTNADINRSAAIKCSKAGMSAAQIAAEWPEVWQINAEGKIGQRYDYALADGSGRYETNRIILAQSVAAAIKRHRRATR